MVRFSRALKLLGPVVAFVLAVMAMPVFAGGTLQPIEIDPASFTHKVITDIAPPRFADPFDAGTGAWFPSNAVDDFGISFPDGLPTVPGTGGDFTSATTSGATYHLQPCDALNCVGMHRRDERTLTLLTPAAYSVIAILASSGNGGGADGEFTINFDDGTSLTTYYNAYDWCNNNPATMMAAAINAGRDADIGMDGTGFNYGRNCDFALYETLISIDQSVYPGNIVSLSFDESNTGAFFTGVFAISGQ